VGLVAGVLGPPISAKLMNLYGPYGAYSLSISVLFLAFPQMLILPGTPSPKRSSEEESASEHVPTEAVNSSSSQGPFHRLQKTILGVQGHIRKEIFPLFQSKIITRVILATFLAAFAGPVLSELLQYMHVRYRWSYEKVCLRP
jgi:hypothetical protein